MGESRLNNSVRNIKYAIINTLIISVIPFITRTIFIRILGKTYLGVDALFLNVINLIEIVNIGIGSAITYSVYKPIKENNIEKCRSLFRLYRNCYYVMGTIVFGVGLILTPFITFLIKDKPDIPENLHVIYLIILLGVVSGYFFADKQCIINAHQKNYVISKVKMIVILIINIIEIALLFLTKQYLIYLIVQTCQNLMINLVVAYKAKKLYPYFFGGEKPKPIEKHEKQAIVKNTTALIFNRAGSLIINTTDNIIISAFVGIGAVGIYSNYFMVKNMVNTFTTVFTQSLTSSIGNLNAEEEKSDKVRLNEVFSHVFFINYFLHAFCAVCLFCLLDPFIAIWIGESYCMGVWVALIVAVNYYLLGVQKTAEQFKSACGLFWQDRFRVLIEAGINLVLSIIFVLILPADWKVFGVLLGTLLSNLCVTFWLEPLIVHKYALNKKVPRFYLKNLFYLLIAGAIGAGIFFLNRLLFGVSGNILEFALRVLITVVCAFGLLCLVFIKNKYFRKTMDIARNLISQMWKRVFKRRSCKKIKKESQTIDSSEGSTGGEHKKNMEERGEEQ